MNFGGAERGGGREGGGVGGGGGVCDGGVYTLCDTCYSRGAATVTLLFLYPSSLEEVEEGYTPHNHTWNQQGGVPGVMSQRVGGSLARRQFTGRRRGLVGAKSQRVCDSLWREGS